MILDLTGACFSAGVVPLGLVQVAGCKTGQEPVASSLGVHSVWRQPPSGVQVWWPCLYLTGLLGQTGATPRPGGVEARPGPSVAGAGQVLGLSADGETVLKPQIVQSSGVDTGAGLLIVHICANTPQS